MQAVAAENPGEMHRKMLSEVSCNTSILNLGPAQRFRDLGFRSLGTRLRSLGLRVWGPGALGLMA